MIWIYAPFVLARVMYVVGYTTINKIESYPMCDNPFLLEPKPAVMITYDFVFP